MRRTVRAFALLLVVASSRSYASGTVHFDGRVRPLLAGLLKRAWSGTSDYERGAFLVERSPGEWTLEEWGSADFRRARFSGRLPSNVVAVVHTHPPRIPRPSPRDVAECVRTGIPFLVLSRGGVWQIDPAKGDTMPMEESPSWWAATPGITTPTSVFNDIVEEGGFF